MAAHSIEEKCNKFILVIDDTVQSEHFLPRHFSMQFSHAFVKTTMKFRVHLRHTLAHFLLAKINVVWKILYSKYTISLLVTYYYLSNEILAVRISHNAMQSLHELVLVRF